MKVGGHVRPIEQQTTPILPAIILAPRPFPVAAPSNPLQTLML